MSDHPMQPIYRDDQGIIRFQPNKIIGWLFDQKLLDLNKVAAMAANGKFSADDQMQIAQQLGYSVSSFGDLSYVTDEMLHRADMAAGEVMNGRGQKPLLTALESARTECPFCLADWPVEHSHGECPVIHVRPLSLKYMPSADHVQCKAARLRAMHEGWAVNPLVAAEEA
jgi:hypothetical protein